VEVDRLRAELEKSKGQAREEEEKRLKAISLLKSVRQKLVKAERDRDEALKEVGLLREREIGERDKEREERTRLQSEIDAVNIERESAVVALKAQFDQEISNSKDRFEKEISAMKGQYELESAAAKVRCHVLPQ
jgi:hypothetical protein